MTVYRELPLLSKLIILFGGFYTQFGLAFFSTGLLVGIFMLNAGILEEEPSALLTLITPVVFSIVGGTMATFGISRNIKALQLLQYGILTTGTLKNTEYTNTRINHVPEIKYHFVFKANGNDYTVQGRTHLHHLVTDEKNERIIYNPEQPEYAIIYDLIPNAPELIDQSQLKPLPNFKVYMLILPAIAFVEILFLLKRVF